MIGLVIRMSNNPLPPWKMAFPKVRADICSCSRRRPTVIKKSGSIVTHRGGTVWQSPHAAALTLKSNLHDVLGCFIWDLF